MGCCTEKQDLTVNKKKKLNLNQAFSFNIHSSNNYQINEKYNDEFEEIPIIEKEPKKNIPKSRNRIIFFSLKNIYEENLESNLKNQNKIKEKEKKQKNFSVPKLDIQNIKKKFPNLNIKKIVIPNKKFYSNKIKLILSNFNTYYSKGSLSSRFYCFKNNNIYIHKNSSTEINEFEDLKIISNYSSYKDSSKR